MKTFVLHPEAIGDLDEIAASYRDSGLGTASRLVDEFFAAFDLLVQFPHHGFRNAALTSRPIRFKLFREFLIAYAPETEPLWIIAVVHGRRNPRVIAALLRSRE